MKRHPHPMILVLTLTVFAAAAGQAVADVTLPKIFSDHMVLQREALVPVWGWAAPGEEVTVDVGGQTKTATADDKGKWLVKLDKLQNSEPMTLTVRGKNTLTVHDVLAGEVWLCSGQSNMGMSVGGAKDFPKEKEAADLPLIRMFTVTSGVADSPQEKCEGQWRVCSPETVGSFSATAYFFGREIQKTLMVPVGLIHSSVGGTPIEAWTSKAVQEENPELKLLLEKWDKQAADWDPAKAQARYVKDLSAWKEAAAKAKEESKPAPKAPPKPVSPRQNNHYPASLFNGKIAPLVPYAIRGAIWYQGESNAGAGQLYGLQLATLINDWRARWGQGDFPFGWVQLPNFHNRQKEPVEDSGWVLVREGMLRDLRLPNTGMAITVDVGEGNNIHPKDKQDVGKRLALWALAEVYGRKVAASGPLPAGQQINAGEVTLSFKHADGGLVARVGELKGFAIAGADKKWHWANARIAEDQVVVSHPEVKEPVAVRYDWADNPVGNLYNGAGLPASPFRTDDWPVH